MKTPILTLSLCFLMMGLLFSVGISEARADCSRGSVNPNSKVNLAQDFNVPISGTCEFPTPRTYYDQMPGVSFVVGGTILPLQPRTPEFYCNPSVILTRSYEEEYGTFSYIVGPSAITCGYYGNGLRPPSTPVTGYNSASITGPVSMKGGYQAEDRVIEAIATGGTVTVQVGGLLDTDKKVFADIPATNCVKLSGNGPIKVVFMRATSINGTTLETVGGFVSNSQRVIREGFSGVDPFKTYFNQFSFYIDLHKDDDLTKGLPKNKVEAWTRSSCQDGSPNLFIYYNQYGVTPSAHIAGGLIYMDISPFKVTGDVVFDYDAYTPIVEMHETAHALAGIMDEYIASKFGSMWNFQRKGVFPENCSTWPRRDYRSSINNKMYGAKGVEGCYYMYRGDALSPKDTDLRPYYRPSLNGIMNTKLDAPDSNYRFNVISCGYLIASFKRESITTKAYAERYWPECKRMAENGTVIMDGIEPENLAPTLRIP